MTTQTLRAANEQLQSAAQAVSTAVMVLRMEEETFKSFLEEHRKMENFGPILDPTLFRDPTRRAVSAVVEPLFRAAVDFLRVYDAHATRARQALEKVT
jgi:hypothetical protein